jgi:pimeloyl-ACP methyl ester carboxylesterase
MALFEPLARRGVQAVALDLTGQYESLLPEGGTVDLARFAADVWEVACLLPRPLVMVGHSFGGHVVREAVLSDPLAVDGLVLIASGPAAIPVEQQAVLQQFVQVMDAHGLPAVWQAKQAMDAAAGVVPPAGEVAEFLGQRFVANAPESLQAIITELCAAEDDTEALAAVTPPAAVVIGALDDVWPIAEQRAMARALGATVVELDGVGHSPAVEAPKAVAEVVTELLLDND